MGLACSWPCFEYWFLLHFRYTDRPFDRAGPRSPCDECTQALRAPDCWPDYEKNKPGLFTWLLERLGKAMKNAGQVVQAAPGGNKPKALTEVHRLVQYLQSLAEKT